MSSYFWKDTSSRQPVPHDAVVGGRDIDGSTIYIGRAYHEGDWLPAKVIPSKRTSYISYGGKEIPKHEYQLLCEPKFEWENAYNGCVPNGAVEGGRTNTGEALYIGRVNHKGSLTIGKVHPSHRCCYIPFDGQEISFTQYEVLVRRLF